MELPIPLPYFTIYDMIEWAMVREAKAVLGQTKL